MGNMEQTIIMYSFSLIYNVLIPVMVNLNAYVEPLNSN